MIIRTPRELGSFIRETRRGRDMTQAELALRAGVSRKWLIGLEAGKRTSELSLVLRTLNALGIDLDASPRAGPDRPRETDIDRIVNAARRSRQ